MYYCELAGGVDILRFSVVSQTSSSILKKISFTKRYLKIALFIFGCFMCVTLYFRGSKITSFSPFFIPGHEFIGRNSYPGALQLSVREMRDITTDLSCTEHAAGCMTVGPGVYWIEAYKAVSYLLLQAKYI